jgi:transposase InsO family protein
MERPFDLAMEKNPNAKPIFHSNRGYQYTSKVFKVKLTQAGMIQSVSRKEPCIDNRPQRCYLDKFNNLETLKESIIKYIDFYNHYRLQANLKGLTPFEYRNQALLTI